MFPHLSAQVFWFVAIAFAVVFFVALSWSIQRTGAGLFLLSSEASSALASVLLVALSLLGVICALTGSALVAYGLLLSSLGIVALYVGALARGSCHP